MRWRCLLLGAPLAALAASVTLGPITFEEIGAPAGVQFVSNNSPTPASNNPKV